jgi:Tol biopolymer transport system component
MLTRRYDSEPAWSPDGRWIAFAHNRGNHRTRDDIGPSDVYVIGARGGGLKRLTRNGARNPLWSPSGDRIAFEAPSGWQVWSIRTNHRLGRLFARVPARVTINSGPPRWSKDGKHLVFLRPGKAVSTILKQRHAIGATFSPDGRRVVFITPGDNCHKDGIWLLRVTTLRLKHLVKPCPAA